MSDKRRYSRASAGFLAEVIVDGTAYPVTTRNLSMKGILATANLDIQTGKNCEIQIRLAPTISITVEGCVVRADAEGTAVEFQSMDDESFGLLHRLMQWNAEDADVIDEELRRPGYSPAI